MLSKVKSAREIIAMRRSGNILATVLKVVANHVEPGISTKELADIAAKELKVLGGQPAFLGHQGYPDVICISVNSEIVHGIPSPKHILKQGDIVGLDFGVSYERLITDGAISVGVGKIAPEHQKLLQVAEQSLADGVQAVHGGVRVGDISAAIESAIRRAGHYGIPRDLVGHGVGAYLWEEPNIPNFGRANTGPWLQANMTVAIEPMVTEGTDRIVMDDDGWTIRTADESWAAHFEHTVLITDEGAEILTLA